jgi:hypothetical protein
MHRSGRFDSKVFSITTTLWYPALPVFAGERANPIIRISASFDPSTVRVNSETVYSGRHEAGVVITSIGQTSAARKVHFC